MASKWRICGHAPWKKGDKFSRELEFWLISILWYRGSARFTWQTTKSPVIRTTFFFNLQYNIVALQVEKRCCTCYHAPTSNIVTQQNFVVASLQNVDVIQFNLLQHAASTCNNEIFLRYMFEVCGNTYNNAFQFSTQQCCIAILVVLLHLKIT